VIALSLMIVSLSFQIRSLRIDDQLIADEILTDRDRELWTAKSLKHKFDLYDEVLEGLATSDSLTVEYIKQEIINK
jgi:ribonucleotide reductase beta subunit family protein with ferritin-like domain